MKTRNVRSSNSFIRSVTVASLCAASSVLVAACQGDADNMEPAETEELSAPEAAGGAEEADSADVGTAEGALLPARGKCEVRCCNNALHHVQTASQPVCLDTARSFCGGGSRVKRVQFRGHYILARVC
jgi:hypothetical protein